VGKSIARWIRDWKTIQELADKRDQSLLLSGKPAFLGYVTSAYKVSTGRSATNPHEEWERKIAPRVRDRIIQDLKAVDPKLVTLGGNKLGQIKNFHSLAPEAQRHGVAIGNLRGLVNTGHYAQVDEAKAEFQALAHEIIKRAGI
jgi:hypothetical protein